MELFNVELKKEEIENIVSALIEKQENDARKVEEGDKYLDNNQQVLMNIANKMARLISIEQPF